MALEQGNKIKISQTDVMLSQLLQIEQVRKQMLASGGIATPSNQKILISIQPSASIFKNVFQL